MLVLLILLLAYLLGSIPFSFFIARRIRGIDLREHGSGNLGATNVFRTLGPWWGVGVLLLDMAKGAAAVLIMSALAATWTEGQLLHIPADLWRIFAGAAAAFGHTFSPFVKFQGGKGVATTGGCFFVLAPWPTVFALTIFGLIFGLSRIVSLGSICAAASLPVAVIYFESKSDDFSWTISIFTLLVASWVVIRHRANIKRLADGNEAQLIAGGQEETTPPPAEEGIDDES